MLTFMIFDLHVHTDISSCSNLDVNTILVQAGKKGLDGICITDHQTTEIRHYIKEGLQANGIYLIPGMEYETRDGDFLIFGPYDNLGPGLDGMSLLDHVNRTGGVAVAAHPFREGRPVNEYLIQEGWCRVFEGVNGRNTHAENLMVENWRKKYSMAEVGGSDAHTIDELGKAVTRFTTPVRSANELIHALKNNLCRPECGYK